MQADTTNIKQNNQDLALSFNAVFQQELNTLIRPNHDNQKKLPDDLIGLAFSGGGIRSATFNLGVLQALANANLLNKIDYLSTVSGGGYVGSFFTSMFARPKQDSGCNTIDDVREKLRTDNKLNGQEAAEIGFLRQYSNYLTPKIGLSTDAFAAISVWFTNTLLNQVVLISFLMALSASVFWLNQWLLKVPSTGMLPLWIGSAMMLLTGIAVLFESKFFDTQFFDKPFFKKLTQFFCWQNTLAVGMVGAIIFSWGLVPILQSKPKAWWFIVFSEQISAYWLILPSVVLIISLLIVAGIGLAGRQLFKLPISSFMREWWGRLGGVTLFLACAWLLMLVCMLYLPLKLSTWLGTNPFQSASFSLAGAWAALTWLAVHLGNSASTNGLQTNKLKEKASILLPWLVIISLVVLVSLATHAATLYWFNYAYSHTLFWSLAIWLSFSLRVDANIFSQHYFYRNRLTRGYLGATHNPRNPNVFTGFDESDDIEFRLCKHRPLHIVNTALNLTSTKNLAWQQRKAASFAFTPLYCGFEFPDKTGAYRPTEKFTNPYGGVKLGSIMAVSGAAASPNMGYHSSAAAAFLLTVFNVRLGRWYGNPLLDKKDLLGNPIWQRQSPIIGFFSLIKELFAKTKEGDRYIYCSDGGHFENLGIYELARRRCKLIIAVDVGQDEHDKFEDLGNAIRKCQVDLGVQIDMRVDTVRKDPVTGLSPKHYALANITYPANAQKDFEQGVLIYIKSSLTGEEPADIQNFKKEEPAFPHHSTVDQFFDEKQFESYRHLGKLVMESTLSELAIEQALAQVIVGVGQNYKATIKSTKTTTGTASQPALATNLQTLVKKLRKQAKTQIDKSKAQNKPLNAATERAKVLNALDEKAKNLVS